MHASDTPLLDRARLHMRVLGALNRPAESAAATEADYAGVLRAPSLVLLAAAAGYGKSVLARQIAEHLEIEGCIATVTMHCAGQKGHAAGFWARLRLRLLGDQYEADSAEVSAREQVFAYAARLPAPVLLVLDGYERVSRTELDLDLLRLAETPGGALRLLVLARNVEVLAHPEHAERVLTIDAAELAFTDEETRELGQRYGVPYGTAVADPGALGSALALCGGWPITVSALLRAEAASSVASPALADPVAALRTHLDAGRFAAAEELLALNFTAIIDQESACLQLLMQVPDAVLLAHPALAAARLFTESSIATVAPRRILRTRELMHAGAKRRLEEDVDPLPDLQLIHRMLVMIGTRLHGDAPAALAIAQRIETELLAGGRVMSADGTVAASTEQIGVRSQPVLLEELGYTAFVGGDSGLARRAWQRLDALMRMQAEGSAAADAVHRSAEELSRVTCRPHAWRLAALGGLSLVESNEGDFTRGAELLDEAERVRAHTGATAPALTWVNAEVARAHHAYESLNERDLHDAVERITPWFDRIEQWPMVLMAQAEHVRWVRGTDWTIPFLRAGIAEIERERHGVGVWGGYLALYQVMLNTSLGNFVVAKKMLAALPAENAYVQIEQARLKLFAGDHVRALLRAQRLGVAGLNLRQQIDRSLIAAVAAWGCGKAEEAIASLRVGVSLIERCNLSMMLRSVPFEPLMEIAGAARDAGAFDRVELIESVPVPARCIAREQLTTMERRALETMVTHQTLAEAAAELQIAQATVKRHRLAVYRKLRVRTRDEAILQATRMGLLPQESGPER